MKNFKNLMALGVILAGSMAFTPNSSFAQSNGYSGLTLSTDSVIDDGAAGSGHYSGSGVVSRPTVRNPIGTYTPGTDKAARPGSAVNRPLPYEVSNMPTPADLNAIRDARETLSIAQKEHRTATSKINQFTEELRQVEADIRRFSEMPNADASPNILAELRNKTSARDELMLSIRQMQDMRNRAQAAIDSSTQVLNSTPGSTPGTAGSVSSVQADRQAREAALAAEREARILKLNQVRERNNLGYATLPDAGGSAADVSLDQRYDLNPQKMTLLRAYKQRREQELQAKQERYQQKFGY